MKIGKLFLCALASAAVFAGCKENEENLGTPSIKVDPATLDFSQEGGADNAKTVTLTSTRDWTAEVSISGDEQWITVSPESGEVSSEGQPITVTVLENAGTDRTATVTFKTSTVSTKLTVNQDGPGGSVEDTYVYCNDFDKELAQKGDSGYPFLDEFDGWKNETGSGIANVTYSSSGASARVVGKDSSSDMSLYEGSGGNNIFFGKSAYFQIGNIALDGSALNYTLSFGAERYGQDEADNTFNHDEFKVYVSNDGTKWVELEYSFAKGSDPNGKWDLASSTFTVPSGTASLFIYFDVNYASVYRIDDLKLATSASAGTEIDFSQGIEIGGGDEPVEPGELVEATVAEFIAASESETVYYKLTGEITDLYNTTYGNFTLVDETGSVKVYGLTKEKVSSNDKSFSELGLKEGDIVTLAGTRDSYGDEIQVGGPAYYISHEPGKEDPDEPVTPPAEGYLIISEYVEGSGMNKYIELYNPTGKEVNLDGYTLAMYNYNKSNSLGETFTHKLEGTLAAGATLVFKNSKAELYDGEAIVDDKVMNFNGNDPVALLYGDQVIDMFGPAEVTGDFAKDKTFRRKASVKTPSAKWVEAEWDESGKDDGSGLGSHTIE